MEGQMINRMEQMFVGVRLAAQKREVYVVLLGMLWIARAAHVLPYAGDVDYRGGAK
jgi:hypothetical protein